MNVAELKATFYYSPHTSQPPQLTQSFATFYLASSCARLSCRSNGLTHTPVCHFAHSILAAAPTTGHLQSINLSALAAAAALIEGRLVDCARQVSATGACRGRSWMPNTASQQMTALRWSYTCSLPVQPPLAPLSTGASHANLFYSLWPLIKHTTVVCVFVCIFSPCTHLATENGAQPSSRLMAGFGPPATRD